MTTQDKKLMRLPEQGQIAGVCAGIADFLEVDVTLVRLIFIVLIFATGGGMILVYLILAVAMPVAPGVKETSKTVPQKVDDKPVLSRNIERLSSEFQGSERGRRMRNYAGTGLIIFGAWLLSVQFFPQWVNFRWDYIWPVILILAGVIIVTRKRG